MPRARLRTSQFRDADVMSEAEHDSWIHTNTVVSGALTLSGTSGAVDLTTNGNGLLVDGSEVGGNVTTSTASGVVNGIQSIKIEWKDADELYFQPGMVHINNGTDRWCYLNERLAVQFSSLSASEEYYIYVESSASGELTASEISASTTTPTEDTSKRGWYNGNSRCIGYFQTDGSSNIRHFVIDGLYCNNSFDVSDYNSSPSNTPTTVSLTAPGFSRTAMTTFYISTYNTGATLYYRPSGGSESVIVERINNSGRQPVNTLPVNTNTSQQIQIWFDVSTSNTVNVRTTGYYIPESIYNGYGYVQLVQDTVSGTGGGSDRLVENGTATELYNGSDELVFTANDDQNLVVEGDVFAKGNDVVLGANKGTGHGYINGSTPNWVNIYNGQNELMASFTDSSSKINHQGSTKLETASNGVSITGELSADSYADINFGSNTITGTGNVYATNYYGDGSNLTGIDSSVSGVSFEEGIVYLGETGAGTDPYIKKNGGELELHNGNGNTVLTIDNNFATTVESVLNVKGGIVALGSAYTIAPHLKYNGGEMEVHRYDFDEASTQKVFETVLSGVKISDNIDVLGDVTTSGSVTATTYYGDGSNLTGIESGGSAGSTTFSGLSDTPTDYGTSGQILTSTGSGIEFSNYSINSLSTDYYGLELVAEYNLSAEGLDETISWDGETDDYIRIEASGNFDVIKMQVNGDSGNNYEEGYNGQDGNSANLGTNTRDGVLLSSASGNISFSIMEGNFKNRGNYRVFNNIINKYSSSNTDSIQNIRGTYWTNDSDDVTSIKLIDDSSGSGSNTGTIRVYRRANISLPVNSLEDITQTIKVEYKDSDELYFSKGRVVINDNLYTLNSRISKQFTSLSSDTGYYVYVSAPSTGNTLSASDFSASTTGPTVDHDKQGWYNSNDRCIGWFYSNSSSNITKFHFQGGLYKYDAAINIYASTPSNTWTTGTALGPNYTDIISASCFCNVRDANGQFQIRDKDTQNAFGVLQIHNDNSREYNEVLVSLDSNNQFEFRWNNAGNNNTVINESAHYVPEYIFN